MATRFQRAFAKPGDVRETATRSNVDTIRAATRTDLPAIVAIYNQAIPSHVSTAQLEPVTVEERVGWFEAHDPSRHPIWVSETDGAVSGWLSLSPWSDRGAYRHTGELSIYLESSHHGRGLGRMLLAHALAAAPALGLRKIVAGAQEQNTRSRRLFESAGFDVWGRLEGVTEFDGVERDVLLYGKTLT
jgi:L-amino acid N-acyltransferase YncA